MLGKYLEKTQPEGKKVCVRPVTHITRTYLPRFFRPGNEVLFCSKRQGQIRLVGFTHLTPRVSLSCSERLHEPLTKLTNERMS